MGNIIKLKESDLRNLVQQVIQEQQGKDPKVLAVQNALIKAGFGQYLGTTGADGIFGPNTKNAVIQYQLKNNIQPAKGVVGPITAGKMGVQPLVGKTTTTTPTQQKPQPAQAKQPQPSKDSEGYLTKVVGFFKNAASKIGNMFSLPIHIRAFKDFSLFRKAPFTLNDMTENERNALSAMINYAVKTKKIGKGGMVNFYEIANAMNKGGEQINFKDKTTLGLNQGGVKSDYTRIALTIGNARVTKTGNGYKVTDVYDFNNYARNPEKYTWDQTPDTLKDSFAKIGNGNYVQGVEQLASYYQKWGYSGFPVDIDVPTQQA